MLSCSKFVHFDCFFYHIRLIDPRPMKFGTHKMQANDIFLMKNQESGGLGDLGEEAVCLRLRIYVDRWHCLELPSRRLLLHRSEEQLDLLSP